MTLLDVVQLCCVPVLSACGAYQAAAEHRAVVANPGRRCATR